MRSTVGSPLIIARQWSRIAQRSRHIGCVYYSNAASSAGPTVTEEVKSLGSQQKLYLTDACTPGSVFFLPHGARIFNRLVQFMKAQQRKFGFEEVVTPIIYKKELWMQSGHWEHYKNDMFEVFGAEHGKDEDDACSGGHSHGREYSLKPMNCPGHCVMFSRIEHSFRELPIRYSDFSPLHRNEASGALSGLTRVRKFHQDDGHIFCRPDQVQSEMRSCLRMLDNVYSIFGLTDYELTLSTRPDSYIGELDMWTKAESDLKAALTGTGKPWTINEGDGAFYGPKIDILVKDNLGKQHQTATIQLDFQLPKNFELTYVSSEKTNDRPVLIHRAIFGSLERFLAILIDHYQGKWPFWLNPRQAVVIPVAERHAEYAQSICAQLSGVGLDPNVPAALLTRNFHVEAMTQDEPVSVRIKRAIEEGYAYILMVGDREMESKTVSLRERSSRKTEAKTVDEVRSLFSELEDSYM